MLVQMEVRRYMCTQCTSQLTAKEMAKSAKLTKKVYIIIKYIGLVSDHLAQQLKRHCCVRVCRDVVRSCV